MSERTEADYAIEFGRYLANAAEAFMAEQNRAAEHDDIPNVEHWNALNSAIYEFRKRADRAAATANVVRRLAVIQRRRATP